MKLNKIHQDLKEAYKEKKRVYLTLGFEFENKNEIERCVSVFRSGYWSVAPINSVDLEIKNYKIDSDRQILVSIKYNTPEEIQMNSDLKYDKAVIMHKAANLVPNLTRYKQIKPKL